MKRVDEKKVKEEDTEWNVDRRATNIIFAKSAPLRCTPTNSRFSTVTVSNRRAAFSLGATAQ